MLVTKAIMVELRQSALISPVWLIDSDKVVGCYERI